MNDELRKLLQRRREAQAAYDAACKAAHEEGLDDDEQINRDVAKFACMTASIEADVAYENAARAFTNHNRGDAPTNPATLLAKGETL